MRATAFVASVFGVFVQVGVEASDVRADYCGFDAWAYACGEPPCVECGVYVARVVLRQQSAHVSVCMCVCMCVCMYVYVYVCMCVCMCMYVCMCVCMYVYVYVCMYVCVYVCVCVCVCFLLLQ